MRLLDKDAAQVGAGKWVVWLQAQGLAVLGNRLVQLPLFAQRNAEVPVDHGVVRLEMECSTALGDRFPEVPSVNQRQRGCCWPLGNRA